MNLSRSTFVCVLLCAVLASSASASVSLTSGGTPAAVILTRPGPSGVITKAAQEFQLHIQLMSGATLPIDVVGNEGNYPGKNLVYIGQSAATDTLGIDYAGLTNEYYTVRTISSDTLCIVGKDGGSGSNKDNWRYLSDCYPGNMFGVYYVLGDVLGCRWIWPGDLGRYVPANPSVSVTDLDITDGPLMEQRSYRIPRIGKCYLPTSQTDYGIVPILPTDAARRNELADEEYLWLRRQRMGTRVDPPFAHYFTSWWTYYGPSGTKSQHPEWFAYPPQGGNPGTLPPTAANPAGADRMKLNLTNPGVWNQRMSEAGSSTRINVCPTDSKYHCTCANCMAWDQPAGQSASTVWNSGSALLGTRYAKFYNEIAKLAAAKTQGAVVYGYAYDVYRHPPIGVTMEPNTAIALIPGASSDTDLTAMQGIEDDVLGWMAAGCEQMFLRPNWMLGEHCGPSWPLTRVGNHFRAMTADGFFRGLDSDSSNSSYACMGPYLYLIARLMADPSLTVDQIKAEYVAPFGAAAPKVLEYLNYWENFLYALADGGNSNIQSWSACVPAYPGAYTVAAFDAADVILNQAYALVPSDAAVRARLDFLKLGNTHGRLTSQAIALVNPSIPPAVNTACVAKMQELLAFRDANAESWAIWREWFIQREADYVPGMEGYWTYVLSGGGGGGGGSTAGAFIENGGMVVMEAEHFTEKQAGTGLYSSHQWQEISNPEATGGKAMQGLPNAGAAGSNGTDGPRMDFRVDFTTTGVYYIFVRMPTHAGSDDTLNVGQDGAVLGVGMGNTTGSWRWRIYDSGGLRQAMVVPSQGVYTFNIWMREDGVIADKIILTNNSTYTIANTDTGPVESQKHSSVSYTLTVVNGSGDGQFGEGSVANITANTPGAGEVFDQWDGDVDYVTDVFDPTTTVVMPASDVMVSATYKLDQTTYALTVNSGTGDGNYQHGEVVVIAADAAPGGQIFDRWTGDTSVVTDFRAASTSVTMPAAAVSVTATYKPYVPYTLTVNSGTGDGLYVEGQVVPITADTPPAGQGFDKWTGDTSAVTNVLSSSTSITMPAANVTVTATYKPLYTLAVTSGSGDGSYFAGVVVPVVADAPQTGYLFDKWTGDVASVANVNSPSTTVTMPAANVSITAAYKRAYILTVNSGTGDGQYVLGTVVPIVADTPAVGYEFDHWSGDVAALADIDSVSTNVTIPPADVTVTATYRLAAGYYQLTVNSGSGDGAYEATTVIPIAADAPATGYAFDHWTGDTASVAVSGSANTYVTMPAANIAVTALYRRVYTLTVNSGAGDGQYAPGAVVQIVANTPIPSQLFDRWTGDTAAVANVNSSTTTLTMPAADVAVTAAYKSLGIFVLNLNGTGTGGGTYPAGTNVPIQANNPPAGQTFREWTGDTDTVANIYAATTSVAIPAHNVSLVATYGQPIPLVTLVVINGTGDGQYRQGQVVPIAADAPAAGQVFDHWGGDSQYLADPNASSTSVTLPAVDVTVEAVYKTLYTLTVNSGTGDGQYGHGDIVPIVADAPPPGLVFAGWIGDVQPLADRFAASTTVTMPAANVTLFATYVDPTQIHALTVVSGTGSGNYAQGTVVPISAAPAPAGQEFDVWTGDTAYVADVNSASTDLTMPAANVTVTATYKSTIIQIGYPSAAGLVLERGSKTAITWSAPTLNTKALLRIELINGSGGSWVLTERAQAGKGALKWTVGSWKSILQPVYPDGDSYRLRISTLDGSVDTTGQVFAIGTVSSLEILGPALVDENSTAQYTCMAHFNYGAPQDYTAKKIKWSASVKGIKLKLGLLTAGEVLTDQACVITAGYGKSPNYCTGSSSITIRNK